MKLEEPGAVEKFSPHPFAFFLLTFGRMTGLLAKPYDTNLIRRLSR